MPLLKKDFQAAAAEARRKKDARVEKRLKRVVAGLEAKIMRQAEKRPDRRLIINVRGLGESTWTELPSYKKIHEICARLDIAVHVSPVVDTWGVHSGLLALTFYEPYSESGDYGILKEKSQPKTGNSPKP